MSKQKVVIIGGGIGGVALAVGLRHRGISAQVYEAGDDFTELGAGIALGPNAIAALSLLDPEAGEVFEQLATKNAFSSEEATWINFRHGIGEPSLIAKVQTKDDRKTGLSSVHRARFLNSLAALIPRDMVHFGKRLQRITEAGGSNLRLYFDDGTQVLAASVVGCDGVRSSVRQYVLDLKRPLDNVTYTKKYVYRGLVPMPLAVKRLGEELANNSQMYLGPGGHVLSYPIDGGATMNVVAFRDDAHEWKHPSWVFKQRGNTMRDEFEGWGEPVKNIVQMLDQPDQWALFNHEPAATFQKGSVVLLGDAAHATTPHQGAGAGQAIEDALFLAELLDRATSLGVSTNAAFQAYDAVRRPRSQRVVSTSKAAGYTYAMTGPAGSDDELLREELLQRFNWIWEYDVKRELEVAVMQLQRVAEQTEMEKARL
ncbi:putative salicylate hydroxylase [Sporormia fimetaria CBS 119925]|uniref:Putative salicylate hydroxylase n=1 Tax=Sporormia fimetaria CBS 119925 TaxID=1340428 RepID=A0A6A6VJ14_9PLEO|nr:putative salicylate hydroxylase [Sporormia fimetaria CBS 119925]